MTAFAGNTDVIDVPYLIIVSKIEFGVMPEIVKAIEEMDWL